MKKTQARRIYTLEDLGVGATTARITVELHRREIMLELHRRSILAGAHDYRGTLGWGTADTILEYQTFVLRAEDIKAANSATNQSMLRVVGEGR